MKSYISKKVCSLESKLWSVICSQNCRSSSLVMEADVIPRRRANASNNSPAKSFDSFIPIPHSTTTSILRIQLKLIVNSNIRYLHSTITRKPFLYFEFSILTSMIFFSS